MSVPRRLEPSGNGAARLLPSMSGLDALELIKAFDEHIEVVTITPFASLATLNEALRRGAWGYLIKPFPRQALELMIRDALGRRAAQLTSRVRR